MTVQRINASILASFPKTDEESVLQEMMKEVRKNNKKIVVLDDDPTGVQTVHDIYVYTHWDTETMKKAFLAKENLFYILTNSRGLTVSETTAVHKEIAHNLCEVSKQTDKEFIVISRSDSTLRGHYPLETELLKETIEKETSVVYDGEILFPFFKEGGRFTIGNVHYVQYGDELVPAGETEFAKDATFGYSSSNMCEYIEEKTKGKYKATDVTCISLDDLRKCDYAKIESQLENVHGFNKVIVNAIDATDVRVFVTALYRAVAKGKNFLFRTAAAFVKELGGISDQPLLTKEKLITRETNTGGLIVVGSHTAKTTAQLNELKKLPGIVTEELNSDLVLYPEQLQKEVERVIEKIEKTILEGKNIVVYTKRKVMFLENDTKEEALKRSVTISHSVQSLVANLNVTPSFIVAKGGITSSEIGTMALQVKYALVLGQIMPGIPVWQLSSEAKFPGIPYVIFPGNVGDADTLLKTVKVFTE